MKKRVFIIHGWGGSPDSNWFPWAKKELERQEFEVFVPQMPNPDFPQQKGWLEHLVEVVEHPDENTYLIGHSLGVITILRYLQSLPKNQKVGGAILVAGFSESLGSIEEIENFFVDPIDYEKIKSSCEKFVVFNSNDDPYVPVEKGEILRDKLNSKFILLKGAGHINLGSGYFEFPEVIEELINLAN